MKLGWVKVDGASGVGVLVGVEFGMAQHSGHHSWWRLLWEIATSAGLGGEGVGAMVEHALGEATRVRVGLDAQVAEHGVGFPASQ